MGGKEMEGNEEQKRKAAREAKEAGQKPSEVGATKGASQQPTEADDNMTHQQKLDLKREGKEESLNEPAQEARPGSRDSDTPDNERYPRRND